MIEQNQNTEQTTFTPVEVVESHQLVLPTEKDFEVVLMGEVDDRIAEVSKELSKLLKGNYTDKKAYNAMKDFKNKIIVKMRTGTSGRADELLEDARKYTNKVHEIKKSIIEKVQTKLESKAVAWLEEADRIAKEEENKKIKEAQERFDSRLKELTENGVSFNGQWYAINDIAIGKQMLEEMNDEIYDDLIDKVKVQNEANIQKAKDKEEADRLEAERQENLRLENERQKAELDKMKKDLELQKKQMADAKKEIRQQQLAPYIVFIRDYSGLLGMSDEDYQKEFEDIKKGAQLQWEQDKKQKEEEAKLAEKKEREAKEAQQKLEAEKKLLAERALPYEELGFKYNYTKGTWGISIGELYSLEITKIELLENSLSYDIVAKNVSKYKAKEEERLSIEEKVRYFIQKLTKNGWYKIIEGEYYKEEFKLTHQRLEELTEEEFELTVKEVNDIIDAREEKARKALLDEKQLFNEYVAELKKVSQPTLTDSHLLRCLSSITNHLNEVF